MGTLLSEPVTAMVVEQATSTWWEASSASMQGWRKKHEDAHILQVSAGGPGQEAGVFAVLDGHGGQVAALLSKELLQACLLQHVRQGTLDEAVARDELEKHFLNCDATLRERLPPGDTSGTTVIAAVVTQNRPNEYCVVLANAGDSRAVVFSADNGLFCSEDHKPSRRDETARIQAAGGTVERGPLGGPWRVDGSLAVSRAMGDFSFKPARMPPRQTKVSALPEVSSVYCRPGDWILLACDGIFDVMSNEEAAEFVNQRILEAAKVGTTPSSPAGNAGAAWCVQLLEHVLEKGSKDNCTALLVQFSLSEGTPAPYRKELLKGKMDQAPADIKLKYLEFIEAEGFSPADVGLAPASRFSLGGGRGSAGPGVSKTATDPGPVAAPAPRASSSSARHRGVSTVLSPEEQDALKGGAKMTTRSSGKETSADSTVGSGQSSGFFGVRRSSSQPVGRRASANAGNAAASSTDADCVANASPNAAAVPRTSTISKALQAMKSTRTIQRAWRRTRDPETTDDG